MTYYEGSNVRITNARAILNATTYAMANITSVRMAVIEAKHTGSNWIIIIGVLVSLLGLPSFTEGGWMAVLFGLGLCGLGALVRRGEKDKYVVMIGSAGGEQDALGSYDADYIKAIVAALNEAIVRRG